MWLLPTNANGKGMHLLPRNRADKALLVDDPDPDPAPACITLHGEFSSACLCQTVLTIAYNSHQHHYGNSSIPIDENRKQVGLQYID